MAAISGKKIQTSGTRAVISERKTDYSSEFLYSAIDLLISKLQVMHIVRDAANF